jgi:hypothetical protein
MCSHWKHDFRQPQGSFRTRRAAGPALGAELEWLLLRSAQKPAHHCAVGVEHIASRIDKQGALPGIEAVPVR